MKWTLFLLLLNLYPLGFSVPDKLSATDERIILTDRSAVQSGIIFGRVTLPQNVQNQRVFRGRSYRQRTGTVHHDSGTETTESESNQFTNVVISAHPLSFNPDISVPEKPLIINQINAEFVPNVTPAMVGTTVQFLNSDSFYHNVFSLTPGARFNIGRRPTGDVVDKKVPPLEWEITGLGEIEIFCDIHPQMNGFILSLDTPYFNRVSEDGSYRIENLPAGRYEIRSYHPANGIQTETITLKEDASVSHNFNYIN